MAYYLTRPCAIQPNKTMYYKGFGCWTDRFELKETYNDRTYLDGLIENKDGLTGGFKKATVVEE